ncbi:MAG TPA: hypothetical protein VHN14_13090 [Kofleriaceae bacterium]|jgi:hypothetical protein|nr:hypothetical protein [Kofleriaceae bacterium]
MIRLSKTSLIATLVAMTGTAFADDPAAPSGDPAGGGAPAAMAGGKGSKIVGADVVGILPLGDYGNAADFAIGAVGRFEYGVTGEIAVTGRVGYIYNLGTPDGFSLSMIPLLVGGTYKIGTSGLFAQAELGITNIRTTVDIQGISTTKFSIGGGVGYQKDKIKARVGFFMPGSQDNANSSTVLYGILASVGYDFVAL